jgi:hypothetical protein
MDTYAIIAGTCLGMSVLSFVYVCMFHKRVLAKCGSVVNIELDVSDTARVQPTTFSV